MSRSSTEVCVILVTGANKGIGFHVVKRLLQKSPNENNHIILLACRDLQRGEHALQELGFPKNVHLLQLDMSSTDSIQQAVKDIKDKYNGQLDVVINNAGIATEELTIDAARKVFAVNYYGIKFLNELLFPILRKDARIINVSSQVAAIQLNECSIVLQEKYTSSTLTIDELDELVNDFLVAVESNRLDDLGYHIKSHNPFYGISKAALNALTQIEVRQWSMEKNLLIVAVTPGFCATDMTQNSANARSPEYGADSILHAIFTPRDELENGGFYRDGVRLSLIFTPIVKK